MAKGKLIIEFDSGADLREQLQAILLPGVARMPPVEVPEQGVGTTIGWAPDFVTAMEQLFRQGNQLEPNKPTPASEPEKPVEKVATGTYAPETAVVVPSPLPSPQAPAPAPTPPLAPVAQPVAEATEMTLETLAAADHKTLVVFVDAHPEVGVTLTDFQRGNNIWRDFVAQKVKNWLESR